MASPFGMPDEFVQGFFKSGQNLLQGFVSRPDITASPLAKAQAHYWEQQVALWMGMRASAASGKGPEPVVAAERGDRRFHAEDWRDNPWYSLLKQTYLLNARLLGDMVESQLKRERMIADMAIENIVNNISRLVKQPATQITHVSEIASAADEFRPDAIVLGGTLRDFDYYEQSILESFSALKQR